MSFWGKQTEGFEYPPLSEMPALLRIQTPNIPTKSRLVVMQLKKESIPILTVQSSGSETEALNTASINLLESIASLFTERLERRRFEYKLVTLKSTLWAESYQMGFYLTLPDNRNERKPFVVATAIMPQLPTRDKPYTTAEIKTDQRLSGPIKKNFDAIVGNTARAMSVYRQGSTGIPAASFVNPVSLDSLLIEARDSAHAAVLQDVPRVYSNLEEYATSAGVVKIHDVIKGVKLTDRHKTSGPGAFCFSPGGKGRSVKTIVEGGEVGKTVDVIIKGKLSDTFYSAEILKTS